jgi:hypothetical protein
MTELLAGREGRSYTITGIEGQGGETALLAGRKGLSYAAGRAAARL